MFLGASAPVIWGSYQMLGKLTARGLPGARQQAAEKKLNLWVWLVNFALALGIVVLVDYLLEDLFGPVEGFSINLVWFLFLALANLGVSLRMILSPTTRIAVTKHVQHPPGLSRWMDVYASADPVPNGPTRIETSAQVMSVKVWNRGARLSDHTTYWENLDGFVLRVARICAETAESPWQDKLPRATQGGWLDRRAQWRVGLLRWMVWGNRLLWAILLVVLWTRHQAHVPVPFSFPSWSWDWGPSLARSAILLALVLLAAWAAAALLRWPWSAWVRADQEAVLAHKLRGL